MKLSVILPNYNHAHLVGNALDSILSQSRPPDELLILDDGSTDNSVEILKKYEAEHDCVTVHVSERNRGTVHACNTLFEMATGDYILGFPADDIILPGAFEKAMNLIEQNPGVGACCSDYIMVDTVSGNLEKHCLKWRADEGYLSPEELTEALRGGWVPSFTTFINRKALIEAGNFHADLKWHADWFSYLAVPFRHGICYSPTPFAARRRHADAYGSAGRRRRQEQDAVLRTLLDVIKAPENRDILPHFVRSGATLFFSGELDRLIMMDPSLWDPETLLIAQMPIWDHMQKNRTQVNRLWDERMNCETEHEDLIRRTLLSN